MKIVKFVQPACVQCRMVDGLLSHLGLQVDEALDIAIDDKAYEFAVSHGVQSTPTLMLFDDEGNVVDRVSGTNQEAIKALFAKKN
ncbi:thioredoxin family protein [Paenibacillus alvei]|uniref:thioredoxin family protein n=2 Tax=Paenibacillus alvei TaxID=44250 RepID=UPI000289D273|nr:thioredoxin family protein [Paenibacillus alvei]EJW13904.1 thioredoxin [Paenibacillus alvei DSM 29]MCY9707731.1 thioredoxin family protein [Paenibacillus alvei]MCY9757712.1 thioredoxin family protein [Paenibacillus alvei]MEC0082756.1 thioredoxin family protein [Paenibacillus alvei]